MIALLFHYANILLVYRISFDRLGFSSLQAFFIALFFLFNFAGLEAVVWCCAAGYIVCATWILLGIWVFLGAKTFSITTSLVLGALQLLAFLSWDWGILFCSLVRGNCSFAIAL